MICKKIDISVDSYQETAALYTYFLDNSPEMIPDRKRPLVLICPGGGYEMTSDREAEPVAIQYIAKGYQAAILRYSVKPAKYPLALLQLAKAVAHLREYADEYHIDTEKIVYRDFPPAVIWHAALEFSGRNRFFPKHLACPQNRSGQTE